MKVYTVGQVTRYLSNLVDQDYLLQRISIKGEISNCKYHSMGHIYFSLKDENSSMPCVMFRGDRGGLSFKLEDGQAVVITGTVRIYEKESKVNFYARKITLDGEGEGRLHILFEQLKQRLFEEGLFDFEHKKPIPAYPRRVGIVTASTGAAIQDICKVAHRRNPYVELILYPAKVQGEGAAETIARGIRVLDRMKLDTIIIGQYLGTSALASVGATDSICFMIIGLCLGICAGFGIPVMPGKIAQELVARATVELADACAPLAAAPYAKMLSHHFRNDPVMLATCRSIQFGIGPIENNS